MKVKAKVTLVVEREIGELPKSCSVCRFVDFCDGIVADMTKAGNQFKVAYTRKCAKNCPLEVVEENNN